MKFFHRNSSVICYLVGMLAIMLIDGQAGRHINLWILYFIPIGLATWNLGRSTGLVFVLLALVLLLATAVIWGHPYTNWEYLGISYASKVLAYLVLVFLVAALRKSEVERAFIPPRLPK